MDEALWGQKWIGFDGMDLQLGEVKSINNNNLDIPVDNRQRAVRPVKACVSLWIARSQDEVPDMEMGVNYFFHL